MDQKAKDPESREVKAQTSPEPSGAGPAPEEKGSPEAKSDKEQKEKEKERSASELEKELSETKELLKSEAVRAEKAEGQIKQEQAQTAEMKDKLLRSMAEFDNYRKRTTKEKDAAYGNGVRALAEKILPVVDNFERAIKVGSQDEAFLKGIQMTYDQMLAALAAFQIKPMDNVVGSTFDPHFHTAMQHIEDEQFKEQEIVEVFQKGYMIGDEVLRPCFVKVAN